MPDETPQVGIRPYYQMLGGFLVASTIAVAVIHELKGQPTTLYSVIASALLLLGGLAMLLPEVFKSIIASIPWTKYTGNGV
jgi:hypothetical protein